MASAKYLVLINNQVVRDTFNNPIKELVTDSGVKYISGKDEETDKSDIIENYIKKLLDIERSDELFETVADKTLVERHSPLFKIRTIQTPLYQLKTEIAKTKDKNKRIPGTEFLISEYWEDVEQEFYTAEFVKYAEILEYLESEVQTKRPKYTPFTMKFEGKKLMNIIHIDCPLVFNPMDTIPYFAQKKLYAPVYNEDFKQNFTSFEEPAIFEVPIMQGQVRTFMSTPLDSLIHCGIKKPLDLNSAGVYRLAAGIFIRENYSTSTGNKLIQEMLDLPTNLTVHIVYNTETQEQLRAFTSLVSAQNLEQESPDHAIFTRDANISFIKNNIKEYKDRAITATSPISLLIKEATLIDY